MTSELKGMPSLDELFESGEVIRSNTGTRKVDAAKKPRLPVEAWISRISEKNRIEGLPNVITYDFHIKISRSLAEQCGLVDKDGRGVITFVCQESCKMIILRSGAGGNTKIGVPNPNASYVQINRRVNASFDKFVKEQIESVECDHMANAKTLGIFIPGVFWKK